MQTLFLVAGGCVAVSKALALSGPEFPHRPGGRLTVLPMDQG